MKRRSTYLAGSLLSLLASTGHAASISYFLDQTNIDTGTLIDGTNFAPLFNRPSEAFRYGLSIDVIGAVLEKASGEGGRMTYSPSRALDAKAYPSGGAGMVGTAPDIMRLLETIRAGGKPILKAETAASMMRNQIGSLTGLGPGVGFGGAVVVDPASAHTPRSAGTWQWGVCTVTPGSWTPSGS